MRGVFQRRDTEDVIGFGQWLTEYIAKNADECPLFVIAEDQCLTELLEHQPS